MSHVALTVLAPLAPGRRERLTATLTALPGGDDGPLAQIPGLHMGRLSVVEHLLGATGRPEPGLGPYLLLGLDADGPEEAVLAAVARSCGELLAACVDCPDPADQLAMRGWLLRHRVKDRWTIMPYAGRTVAEVQDGLATRERLGRFARTVATLPPAALRRAFLAEFGP